MNKKQTIELLEKQMPSFYSLEQVINIIKGIDSENKLNEDLALEIKKQISHLIMNIDERKLIDYDSAEFELSYNNTIELNSVNIDLDLITDTIEEVLMEFVEVEKQIINADM